MKTNEDFKEIESLKNLFPNEEEFFEALDDALIFEELKKPSKYTEEIENIERKMSDLQQNENKPAFQVLLTNYKRYLYKHILAFHKEQENLMFKKGLIFGEKLAQNKKDK